LVLYVFPVAAVSPVSPCIPGNESDNARSSPPEPVGSFDGRRGEGTLLGFVGARSGRKGRFLRRGDLTSKLFTGPLRASRDLISFDLFPQLASDTSTVS